MPARLSDIPTINSRNWLVHAVFFREFKRAAAQHLHGLVIDIGCGIKPYSRLIEAHSTKYIGIDHHCPINEKYNIDIMATAYATGIQSDAADSVICTAVMEHLEEPEIALRECHRILKKGGVAIYGIPFIWYLHEEPRDFFRFSKYAIEYLFRKTGFEILEIKALSGFFVTVAQLSTTVLYHFHKGPMKYIPIIPVIGFCIQISGLVLDRLFKNERYTWAYMAVVRKQ
jgi:SAM-dependent methyltransferase